MKSTRAMANVSGEGRTMRTMIKVAAWSAAVAVLACSENLVAQDSGGGTGAVMTGPGSDSRSQGPGQPADRSTAVEPWQVWSQQPVNAPMVLGVAVYAEEGTQVTVSIGGQTNVINGAGLNTQSATNRFYPNLKPYETYELRLSGPNWEQADLVFGGYTPRHLLSKRGPQAVPRPFQVRVDGEAWDQTNVLTCSFTAGNNTTNWVIETRPDKGLRPVVHRAYEEMWSRDEDQPDAPLGDGQWLELGPGRSTNAASAGFRWSVGLGRLWNGLSAGRVRLVEQQITSNLFNGTALSYTARSANRAEVDVVTNAAGTLLQVKAPQGLVDIQSSWSPTQECVLRFYIPAHVGATNTNGLYQVSSTNAFVTWWFRNPDSPGAYNRLQVVEQRPSSRYHTAELSYASQVWQLTYGSGAEARTEKRTVSISSGTRQETVEILYQTNAVYKAIEKYSQFDWGWELTNVVTHPDNNGLTNRFVYYTDSNIPAAFGRLKERWFPGGRWELYCYPYEDEYYTYQCAGWPESCGDFVNYPGWTYPGENQSIRMRPWEDGPTSPANATLTNVLVTETLHWSGGDAHHWNRVIRELAFAEAGGVIEPVKLDITQIADGDYWQPAEGAAEDWRCRGGYLESLVHTIRYRGSEPWLEDLIRAQTTPTFEADVFQYGRGTFTNGTWTASTNGMDFLKVKTSGLDYNLTSYPACWYDDNDTPTYRPVCALGKSVQEWTVLQAGNPVYIELDGMTNIVNGAPAFRAIETRKLFYDSLGHLTNVVWYDGVSSNISRTVYQASWQDANGKDTELKAWEINEVGEKLSYAYDSQKRVATVTRAGVGSVGGYPAQSDLSTNWVYNVAGWLLQETVSAGSLSLNRSQAYDLAGRIIRSTSFDGVSVTNTYSADARTTTQTFPGGLSKATQWYLDGRLKSVTGDTVVAEYHDYRVDVVDPTTVGPSVERVYYGVTNSARWQEQARGSFGQILTIRQPAFSLTNGAPPLETVREFYGTWARQVSVLTNDGFWLTPGADAGMIAPCPDRCALNMPGGFTM